MNKLFLFLTLFLLVCSLAMGGKSSTKSPSGKSSTKAPKMSKKTKAPTAKSSKLSKKSTRSGPTVSAYPTEVPTPSPTESMMPTIATKLSKKSNISSKKRA